MASVPTVLPVCAVLIAASSLVGAGGVVRPLPAQSDTTFAFASGDEVRVSSRLRGAAGIEVCAAAAQGVPGGGKTLYALADGGAGGAGLPTIQRFPSTGTTPACTELRVTSGDSLTVGFTKQVRDPIGRVARFTVGSARLPLAPYQRKRITFRWIRAGVDTVAAAPPPPSAWRRRP